MNPCGFAIYLTMREVKIEVSCMNEKWEYKVYEFSYEKPYVDGREMHIEQQQQMNILGEDGWELVSVEGFQCAYFKRKKN